MDRAANDTRPLQPIVFLTAAIRAICSDIRSIDGDSMWTDRLLTQLEKLADELDRHAEGTPTDHRST